ncbi:hypothetical protein [Wolbachia endosymbiont (group A) of Crataerina pallida]|uniref:head-tail joining protein n=1 Tax=Wolbachia endosymbiont (group A) of Crataerina pallida TaxID=3066144 RepID=UPI00333E4EA7
MQENIKRLLQDCFAHLGKVALYESKDKSYMVQVLKQQPDKLYEIGEGQFVGEILLLEVSVFDVLKPMVGDIAFLIIVRIGHRKAESTARRKDSNRGMFFLALFFIANQ